EQRVDVEVGVEQVESALQHGGRRANGVVPIDLAEHHIAGEDHHLGGGLSLVGNRQRIARLVEAEALNQTRLVEVPAVGDAGVEAIAHQIVHLVDVDRAREHASQQASATIGRLVGKHFNDV